MSEKDLFFTREVEVINRWMKQAPIGPEDNLEEANVVADICLLGIREDLPNWQSYLDYRKQGREFPLSSVKKRDSLLHPEHLFTINWSDSGPGYSWPEAYYVTLLPQFNIYVVTISQESPDMYGVTDIAIHHFKERSKSKVPSRALKSIKAWWCSQLEIEQPEWESFLEEGLVLESQACEARDELWSYHIEDEDEGY